MNDKKGKETNNSIYETMNKSIRCFLERKKTHNNAFILKVVKIDIIIIIKRTWEPRIDQRRGSRRSAACSWLFNAGSDPLLPLFFPSFPQFLLHMPLFRYTVIVQVAHAISDELIINWNTNPDNFEVHEYYMKILKY